jgi:hypothetical protein
MERHAITSLGAHIAIVFHVSIEKALRSRLTAVVGIRLFFRRHRKTEYCTDGLVFVENLEVFVYQDDSFLQVIDELLSTPLLNKLFLELVQIRLDRLVLS